MRSKLSAITAFTPKSKLPLAAQSLDDPDPYSFPARIIVGTPSSLDRNGLGISVGTSYFTTPDEQFSFLLSFTGAYERLNLEDSNGFETDVNSLQFQLAPGINYFVSQNFALRASFGLLSYYHQTYDDNTFGDFKRFDFNLNLSNIAISAVFKL